MRTEAGHDLAATVVSRSPEERDCDHPNCAAAGKYRAPKARDRLRDYYWFCLDHVRAYNNAWNFCAGFSEADIEAHVRAATCWERPTWRLGQWHGLHGENAMRRFADSFSAEERQAAGHRRSAHQDRQPQPPPAEAAALAALGLGSDATWADIKARYKHLVKRHHPDANGGDKQAEERLKVINQSYTILRMRAQS